MNNSADNPHLFNQIENKIKIINYSDLCSILYIKMIFKYPKTEINEMLCDNLKFIYNYEY